VGLALCYEGEWSTLHRAPRRARRRRHAASGSLRSGASQMLLYVETWLPLLSVAVTVAILCGLASFMMGRAER
jgi:hypothetical protein